MSVLCFIQLYLYSVHKKWSYNNFSSLILKLFIVSLNTYICLFSNYLLILFSTSPCLTFHPTLTFHRTLHRTTYIVYVENSSISFVQNITKYLFSTTFLIIVNSILLYCKLCFSIFTKLSIHFLTKFCNLPSAGIYFPYMNLISNLKF